MIDASAKEIEHKIREAESHARRHEWREAAERYQEALKLAPFEAELWLMTGICLRESGRLPDAIQYLEKAYMLDDGNLHVDIELGNTLHVVGRFEEAAEIFSKARELHPGDLSLVNNLALSLQAAGRLEEALYVYQSASIEDLSDAELLSNYSALLLKCNKVSEANDLLRRAVEIEPENANAWSNLGISHQALLEMHQALTAHKKASQLAPDDHRIRYNRAMALLLMGEFEEGLSEFEHRRWVTEIMPWEISGPEWTGEEPAGKHILVHAEQGLGDAIQFARFLPLLADLGAKVHFAAHTALVELFIGTFDGVIESVSSATDALPRYDYHIPLLSLPHRIDPRLESLKKHPEPYLKLSNDGRSLLTPKQGKLDIGIVWAGNPNHANDANRSCDLAVLRPLFELNDIRWISLQVGPRVAEIAANDLPIINLSAELTDFAITAAMVSQLDYVISVDTSVLHIAGALGISTCALIPFEPDWRWMLQRSDSPWYPSIRLYRQTQRNDWSQAVETLKQDIRVHRDSLPPH